MQVRSMDETSFTMIVEVEHLPASEKTLDEFRLLAENRQLSLFNSQQADAGLVPREIARDATRETRKNLIKLRFMDTLFGKW
jgi:hypothetical protein